MAPLTRNRFVQLAVLFAALASAQLYAADPPAVALPLTPFEVLGLVQQGAGDEAVIAKLRETGSTFRLSANDAHMLKALGVSDRVLAAMTGGAPAQAKAAAAPQVPAPAPGRPVGKWVRESGPVRIALHFTADRLTATATFPSPDDEAAAVTVTADADYSVSPDGVLYGVFTGADSDQPMAAAEFQLLAGHTFSARCRADGAALTVREVRLLGSGLPYRDKHDEVGMIALFAGGRYEKDDGSRPAPPRKPTKAGMNPFGLRQVPGRCDAAALPPDAVVAPPAPVPPTVQRQVVGVAPDGRPVERVGIDFGPSPTLPSTARPVPFGMLVNEYSSDPVAPTPTPPPGAPVQPVVQAVATTPTLSKPPAPVGTWYRHVGPMLIALKIGPDHLTATVTMTAAVGPTPVSTGMTFSADYVPSKDGGTLHGLITGADVVVEGELPDVGDVSGMSETFKKFGALADQPFALSYRVQDGELIVRNVRVGGPTDADLREPFAMLAGRFQSAGDKPVPKPKPMKPSQTSTGGMTLPSPQYLGHGPQYFPPQVPQAPAPVAQQVPMPIQLATGPVPPTICTDAPLPVPTAPQPVMTATPTPPPAPTGPKLAGTWVREFDGMQVVLKLTDKRLYATLNVAYVEDGKPGEVRMSFRADADYAVGPDGTLFGVVTGTDFTPPQGDCADADAFHKMMAELNGMPFCLRFRTDDGVLSIRDLRADVAGEGAKSAVVLGRYTRADKEPAPPKAVKTPVGCFGLRCQPTVGAATGALIGSGVSYAPDPNVRMDQLMNQTEGIRPIGEAAPEPRPVPPERLHGGIIR